MEGVRRQQTETVLIGVEVRRAVLFVLPGSDTIAVRTERRGECAAAPSGDVPSNVRDVLTALKKPVEVRTPGRQTRCAIPGQRAIMPPQTMLTASRPSVTRKIGDSQTPNPPNAASAPRVTECPG